MDPYLEAPALWPDVHSSLIQIIREDLAALLRPRYVVRVEERVYVSNDDDPGRTVLVPDVEIRKGRKHGTTRGTASEATAIEPLIVTTLLDDDIHETYLNIADKQTQRVVTVIEVLSPSNKVPGAAGRESFHQKRREVIHSPTHWVEIDLLRKGQPFLPAGVQGRGDYFVHVSRADLRPKGWVWPIALTESLPVIKIPLKAKDPEARLELQKVVDRAYDRAGYDLDINYRKSPKVRLTPEQAAWADQLLKSKGLR